MNTLTVQTDAMAVGVEFTADDVRVRLADGRVVSAPLMWFPTLRDASDTQRENFRLIGGGVGIHWPDLDEDISVEGLLAM